MKNIRRITALLLAVATLLCLASCSKGIKGDINVAVLNGPTGIGLKYMEQNQSDVYNVEYYSDPQAIVPLVVSGEIDIACLPLNLAANLYKKTDGGIKMLAINTLGVLHLLEKGDTVKSIADLKGKTILSTGEGATPEFVLNYILNKNGIDPEKDVTIEYLSVHDELATKAIKGKVDICVLPEPFASKVLYRNPDMREALDLTNEWNKVCDYNLAMGCIIARTDFIKDNIKAIEQFLSDAEKSIRFMSSSSGAQLLVENKEYEDIDIASRVVSGCNMVFLTGEEMRYIANANFNVLYDADPKSTGGSVPDDKLYS